MRGGVRALVTTLGLIVLVGALPVVTGIVSAVRVATGLEIPFRVVGFALTAAMEFGLFLLAYAVLTPGSIGWRAHLPGAVVMTLGWELFKLAGGILLASYVSQGDAAVRDDRGRGRAPGVPAAGERAVRVRRRAVRGAARATAGPPSPATD